MLIAIRMWAPRLAAGALLVSAAAAPAAAETTPRLDIEVESELEFQAAAEADDPASEASDLFLKVEAALSLKLYDGLSIESGLVFEPVRDLDPGENRLFGDEGLFVQTLHFQYVLGPVAATGGKINPGFGVAWDRAAGLFGTEVAEDFYEQTERLGFGLSIELPFEAFGAHALSGSVFHVDTSFLSRSIFTERGQTTRADGGPANTESLDSFAFAIDGDEMAMGPATIGYHLGYLHNAAGVTETEDETAVAVALFGGVDLATELRIEPLAEFVFFEGAEGAALDRTVLTLELAALSGPWRAVLTFNDVDSDPQAAGVEELDLEQVQFSIGVDLGDGLGAQAGYKWSDETTDGVSNTAHTLGAKLTHSFGATVDRTGVRITE